MRDRGGLVVGFSQGPCYPQAYQQNLWSNVHFCNTLEAEDRASGSLQPRQSASRKVNGLEMQKYWEMTHEILMHVGMHDYNRRMSNLRFMSVREIRQAALGADGGWVAVEVEDGSWALRCGDVEICTINSRAPRRFRTLEALRQAVKGEIGATEFRVTVVEN